MKIRPDFHQSGDESSVLNNQSDLVISASLLHLTSVEMDQVKRRKDGSIFLSTASAFSIDYRVIGCCSTTIDL